VPSTNTLLTRILLAAPVETKEVTQRGIQYPQSKCLQYAEEISTFKTSSQNLLIIQNDIQVTNVHM